jgi:hypothetical protein
MINNRMAPFKNGILTSGVMKYVLKIYFYCSLVFAGLCSFTIEIFVFKQHEVEHVVTPNMSPHICVAYRTVSLM